MTLLEATIIAAVTSVLYSTELGDNVLLSYTEMMLVEFEPEPFDGGPLLLYECGP